MTSTLCLYCDDGRIERMWAALERHLAKCIRCSSGDPCPAGKCLDTKLDTLIYYANKGAASL